jgi:acetyl/propionyl-CoA carboxylase alpha subunit
MVLLDKILIANRGEIALRIIRSAKKLSVQTVVVYPMSESQADYVKFADESVCLGEGDLNSTFLNIGKIINIAVSTGCKAIHPGYGFLSENPEFAKACEDHNLIFIGPHSDVLRLMGNKLAAKSLAQSLGIPVIFSREVDPLSIDRDENEWHYPVLIKASHGGGGKGMELVDNLEALKHGVVKSARIALNYFGNGALFVEQFIRNARHVEVQIIGDNFNNIIHLYERECSIQRNHQKIIEEAPAQFLTPGIRDKILNASIQIGKAVNYSGAGTVEFLIDESGNFFFMEMNPRIQVEHAVTEEVTGIDIVSEQLKISSGCPLSITQEMVTLKGHAVELRIYAENPAQNFTPSSKPLLSVNLPESPNLRIESDINPDHQITNQFDPLLLKIIASGKNREDSIKLLQDKIRNLNIIGPETNTKYLEKILAHPDYRQNIISVEFCRNNHNDLVASSGNKLNPPEIYYLIAAIIGKSHFRQEVPHDSDPWNALGFWRLSDTLIKLTIADESYNLRYELRSKESPIFVLNGINVHFEIINASKESFQIKIGGTTKELSYYTDNQCNNWISCENMQYSFSHSGILKNYPETVAGSDKSFDFKGGVIKSPLHGKVLEIKIKENQVIKKGDLLMVIEAMKSENRILSPMDAKVKSVVINVGAQVTDQMPLIFLEDLIK